MNKRRKQNGRKRGKRYINNKNTEKLNREEYFPLSHTRDVNSRRIFQNATLACQFLKNYSGIPIFEELSPEDIEDVTSKYQVQMQLLRYMTVIWYDYGKKQSKLQRRKATSFKSFRYPLIIPIVYYEGAKKWTADEKLWQRVEFGKEMSSYIPDFDYKVIRIHDYTNEEIQKNTNEMSLVMMLNKIQSPKDYTDFFATSKEYMEKVVKDTPQELLKILMDVFWALLMKINVPQDEAKELMEHMGARNMGYLFENVEKMDIQAERRNTQEAQKKWKQAEKKLEAAREEIDVSKKEAIAAREAADTAREEANTAKEEKVMIIKNTITNMINYFDNSGYTKEEIKVRLVDFISEKDLELYFEEIYNRTKR